MKVLHVITGIKSTSGGPSRSSQGLVAAECRAGVDAWIYSFDGAQPWIDDVRRYEANAGLLIEDVKKFDLVHIHGLWNPRLHDVAVLCRSANVPYIIAPRGMLEPWSLQQKWIKKKIARFLYQDKDLTCAAALHATAESESEQFRRLGFKNPVIISPNGVNVPKNFSRVERVDREEKRRALFVSRMHPKKGVLELIEAWKNAKMDGWKCELVYTINGDFEMAYEAKVKARVHELGLDDSFIFTGPLDDKAKWAAYARAALFVLPTYSENFGIVVAEALWAGVPVITTKGTPWSELETMKCGWWIDLPAEGSNPAEWRGLSEALATAKELPQNNLVAMGVRGRKLVETKYTWNAVCREMVKGYKDILR